MGEPPPDVDRLDPADAFGLLADGTRAAVVRALGDAWVDDWPGVVAYADLMDRVGAEDSGRFNYHLQRLVGRFVEHREGGYTLNYDGLLVYRAVVAGTFTERVAVGPVAAGSDCFECGGGLVAVQESDVLVVRCEDCGCKYEGLYFPPRGFEDRDDDAVLRAAEQYYRHRLSQMVRGVCPWCGGGVEGRVHRATGRWTDNPTLDVHVRYRCRECGGRIVSAVGNRLRFHPEVVALYADAGLDLTATPAWELEWAVTDDRTEVLAEDPWRLAVTVAVEDESLTAEIDGAGEVVAVSGDGRG